MMTLIVALVLCAAGLLAPTTGFSTIAQLRTFSPGVRDVVVGSLSPGWRRRCRACGSTATDDTPAGEEWKGEVVSNTPDGVIQGCSIEPTQGSVTDWTVTIDGIEADLGRFSEAVYKKIVSDAKRERFQGFRPGTIPPFLEPTYRTYALEECARETVLEAMQQNQIRPFESARTDMTIENVSIPPGASKRTAKKRSKAPPAPSASTGAGSEEAGSWRTFETVKEAIDAGWRPGQSFSFRARNVKGQKVKDDAEVKGAVPLGSTY